MADSKVAKARKRMKTLAAGVSADGLTLDAARIFLGNLGADTLYSAPFDYGLNQPVLTVGSASIGFSGSQYPLIVEAELVVGLAGQNAQDWSNVDNLVAALRSAWLTGTYPAGEVSMHICDFEPFKVESGRDPVLIRANLYAAFNNPDV